MILDPVLLIPQNHSHIHHDHHHDETEQMMSFTQSQTLQMETNSKKKKPKVKRNKFLSLEDYFAFIHSRDHHKFTVIQLDQVISIHGFKKLKKQKEVEEAVGALDHLIDPTRSTLNDNITSSSRALMTLNETIKDLAALNWQDCSVTSIRSIHPLNYSSPVSVIPPNTATKQKGTSNSNNKKRLKAVAAAATTTPPMSLSYDIVGSGPSKSGDSESSSSSLVVGEGKEWGSVGKRKRKSIKSVFSTETADMQLVKVGLD